MAEMRPTGTPEQAPTLAEGAGILAELKEVLEQKARLDARAVDLVDRAMRSGTVEQLEGLPLDLVLALDHRMTRGERWMLQTAAEVLRHLPATKVLFDEGKLSWSQVRDLVGRVRRLPVAARAEVDARIAKSVDLVDELDPDQLAAAVQRAVDDFQDPGKQAEREARAAEDDFVWVQTAIEGGYSKLYGEFCDTSAATICNGLDALVADARAAARRDDADGHGHDDHDTDRDDHRHRNDGDGAGQGTGEEPGPAHDDADRQWLDEVEAREQARRKRDLSRRRGAALVELFARYLGGDVKGRKARPLFTVRVDLDRIHKKGWKVTLEPHTRTATYTWRHRRHRTRVWGTGLHTLTRAEREALSRGEFPATLADALERHRSGRERDRGDQLTLGSTDPPEG